MEFVLAADLCVLPFHDFPFADGSLFGVETYSDFVQLFGRAICGECCGIRNQIAFTVNLLQSVIDSAVLVQLELKNINAICGFNNNIAMARC